MSSKRNVLLDWDGVLRPGLLIIDWAAHLQRRRAFMPDMLEMMRTQLHDYERGTLSYPDIAKGIPALYAEGLKGLDVNDHQKMAVAYAEGNEFRSSISPLGNLILDFLKQAPTLEPIIISGAPGSVLRQFGSTTGIQNIWAVEAEAKGGKFTGRVLDNPAIRERKEQLIDQRLSRANILLAVGDSVSDYPMLNAATYRIAIGSVIAEDWDGRENSIALRDGSAQNSLNEVASFLHSLAQR